MECPSALENLGKGISPIQCGFEGMTSVICCKKRVVITTTPRSFRLRGFGKIPEPGKVAAESK